MSFSDEDIDFLRSKGIFDEGFLEYLQNANDLRTALNLKEISEDEAKELFTIDTIGDFPFEQLKETIAEGKERINCLKNDIIIDGGYITEELSKKNSLCLLKTVAFKGYFAEKPADAKHYIEFLLSSVFWV